MSAPTELRLASDDLEVVLLPELGGRLHRLRAFGHDLLRTPSDAAAHRDEPFFWGAYVMAPWCNRVRPGPTDVEGRTIDLVPNFDDGTAIHGQASMCPWEMTGDGELRVSGGADGSGWPWAYEVVAQVSVEGLTLRLRYRLTNRSDGRMPAGIGLHPWFLQPVEVAASADRVYPANTDSPASPVPVTGPFDLDGRRGLAPGLDATWTGVRSPIELAWPVTGVSARLEVEADRLLVAAASPPHLEAVAVEPQTHGPDGLRRLLRGEPDAPAVLEPGEGLTLDIRLTVALARILRR